MKKRLLAGLLAALMVVTMLPITAKAAQTKGVCGENLTWTLDNDGTLTISGTGDMYNYSNSNYPWNESNHKVKNVVISNGGPGRKSCVKADKR